MVPKERVPDSRILVVIRHAHRDTANRALDNGLSAKGRRQAARAAAYFLKRFRSSPAVLVSSPKRRCLETLAPLAGVLAARVVKDDRLLEQGPDETAAAFSNRVSAFVRDWTASGKKLTVVCAHGDWIPPAARLLAGAALELKKGGWMEFRRAGKSVELRCLIQSFKHFGLNDGLSQRMTATD